jgi:nitroimidazol reductase NimA-like FMN-containing flavoprotein (pyridoxamine 5'-phosphate oxidase superfamily)
MRLAKREVTSFDEIKGIIERCDVCRIALNTDGAPYIVPLNFGFEFRQGEKLTLWFHCAMEGRKLDLIGDGVSAGFEMDTDHELISEDKACGYSMNYASIIGHGGISKVTDGAERLRGLKILMAHYGGAELPFDEALLPRTCVLKLEAENYSCKRLKK